MTFSVGALMMMLRLSYAFFLVGDSESVTAVSYTHLDVYKRQMWPLPSLASSATASVVGELFPAMRMLSNARLVELTQYVPVNVPVLGPLL